MVGRQAAAVWIDHALSDFLQCEVGVPQGSNLGPLLFLIFYNDLPSFLHCELDAYADDSTMTVTAKSTDEIRVKLTENCELVSEWMLGNKLKLNADKTHLMTVGTSECLRSLDDKVNVRDGRTGKIIVSNTNLTLAKKSYSYRGAAQWNTIPENIRVVRKISQFKVQLRKWILLNVTQFVDVQN